MLPASRIRPQRPTARRKRQFVGLTLFDAGAYVLRTGLLQCGDGPAGLVHRFGFWPLEQGTVERGQTQGAVAHPERVLEQRRKISGESVALFGREDSSVPCRQAGRQALRSFLFFTMHGLQSCL